MKFKYILSPRAQKDLDRLLDDQGKHIALAAVTKALDLMEDDPFHPSLRSKIYDKKKRVYESSAQNNTPAAYRIFWHYEPGKKILTILTIVPHP